MKYKIIYADPPWEYHVGKISRKDVRRHYQVLPIEQIKELPISNIAANDSVLFIWCTFPKLQEGLDTIEAWGFEYKTIAFNWIKLNKSGTPFFGMGNWTRSNSEICLLATKGKPKRIDASISSVVMSTIQEHSRKPDEIRLKIIQLCGDLPRVELFARESKYGFVTFGNQVNKF